MAQAKAEFHGFRKRDGLVVDFHMEKIENAVARAAEAASRADTVILW